MVFNQTDPNLFLMLDGNAAAGILNEIFAIEMTACPVECASCGREGELGTLQAFMQAPGIVLRCPGCENIILRVVEMPDGFYLDLRGAANLYLKHISAA